MKGKQTKYSIRMRFPHSRFRGLARFVIILIGFVTIAVFGVISASGQASSPSPNGQTDPAKAKSDAGAQDNKDNGDNDQKDDPDKSKKPKRGSWVFAPIPINSPAFGAGLILGVGYIFKLKAEDKVSHPSTIGAAGAFTNNGSRGIVAAAKLYFDENKYQTTLAFGKGRANYEFFGIGRIPGRPALSVDIEQRGQFFFAEFMRNFGKNIFVGPRYQYRKLTAGLGDRQTQGGFEIPAIDLKSTTAAIGIHVQRDLRDSPFYTRRGSLFDFKVDFFAKPLGSNRNYQTYSLSYNGYRSIGKRQVIAYRGVLCSVTDNTPFFDLCLYGARSDIRGYTAGEFQNHRLFAAQAEYRRELPWRFGLVGFAGFGGVARNWSEFRSDRLLPGAGVGLRYMLDKTNHINYRIDLGFGRSGYTLSFSVTEAF